MLLVAALAHALMQPIHCGVESADLETLAIEAGGVGRLVGFSPGLRNYDTCVPGATDQVVVRAESKTRSANVYYRVEPGGDRGLLGPGGGEETVAIPGGAAAIQLDVVAAGNSARYTVNVDTVCPGSWGAAEIIESNDSGRAGEPQLVTDAEGNVTTVWVQYDFFLAPSSIWSNRYTPGEGWGTGELVELDDSDHATSPQLAVDGNGTVTAVWSLGRSSTDFSVWSNRYTKETGWGEAEPISVAEEPGNAVRARVAANVHGHVVAVWSQNESDLGTSSIYSRRYTPGAGWGVAESIEDNTDSARASNVAVDSNGNAIVTWWQSNATTWSVWANRYTPEGGWDEPQQLSGEGPFVVGGAELVFDATGTATAVWYETVVGGVHDSTTWAARHTTGSGWGAPETIDADTAASAGGHQVGVDAAGNVVVVWLQSDEDDKESLWFNRYTQSDGWGVAGVIDSDARNLTSARLAVDAGGNATVLWGRAAGIRENLWSSLYTPGGSWGQHELVETDDAGDALQHQITADPSGVATAVWTQYDGTRINVLANRTQ